MIETMDQARRSVAGVLNAPQKVRADVIFAMMTVPAANHAFFLWQAAMRARIAQDSA